MIAETNIPPISTCPLCKSKHVTNRIDGLVDCKSCKKIFIKDYNKNPTATGSNNVYYDQGLPALMSDGRFITNYKSSREITDDMIRKYKLKNSTDARKFLQKNGRSIIKSDLDTNWFDYNPKISCSQGWSNYITNGKW